MQIDFHYYATYCAAYLAGYSHEESVAICYSAQFVDCCSRTLLSTIHAPDAAATTQLQLELMEARTDVIGLQDITRIWASFHFLPFDLRAEVKRGSRLYKDKFRLLCNTNSELLKETVALAKNKSLQAAGIAMHILADTWAHRYFAGTPSMVINNTTDYFYEQIPEGEDFREKQIEFRHNPSEADNLSESIYINTLYQFGEDSVMCLGHGRAGHLPDYSFVRYRYLPAWGNYGEVIKDNPSDYYHAFTQMIYALKFLRGESDSFKTETYDTEAVAPYEARIREILTKRQYDASSDWKELGESLSGQEIPAFNIEQYQEEYRKAPKEEKDSTFLGQFILAAMRQKSMVTNRIYKSGNLLAGYSIDYDEKGFGGIRDFIMLVKDRTNKEKACPRSAAAVRRGGHEQTSTHRESYHRGGHDSSGDRAPLRHRRQCP